MPYNQYRYNEVKFKSSHNSYNRDEHILDQIQWENNHNLGCRGLEFDLSQSKDGRFFSVAHMPWYDDDAPHLSQYLNNLRVWSKNNPNHDCITIHLDLKSIKTDNYIEVLDEYIHNYFDVNGSTSLFTPKEIMGNASTLSEGVHRNGWPTLSELKGKFIICISGHERYKERYANHAPKERLAFADVDINIKQVPDLKNQIFLNYNLGTFNDHIWQKSFEATREKYPHAIIRGYVLNNQSIWNNALNSHCNILSTNKISNHNWCKVGEHPFIKI